MPEPISKAILEGITQEGAFDRVEILGRLADRIKELDECSRLLGETGIGRHVQGVSNLLGMILVLLADVPCSTDMTGAWWPEWAQQNGLTI